VQWTRPKAIRGSKICITRKSERFLVIYMRMNWWAICKFAPRPGQIIMPTPHNSVFCIGKCDSGQAPGSVKARAGDAPLRELTLVLHDVCTVYRGSACLSHYLDSAIDLRAYQFTLGGVSPAQALTEPRACPESHLPIQNKKA